MKTQKSRWISECNDVLFGLAVLLFLFAAILPINADAALVFLDDFEDGDTSGWQETIVSGSGGSGSTGAALHNESNMAYVYHRGRGSHSLSYDFDFIGDSTLDFDMQAVATVGYNLYGNPLHANTGVEISFLNFLNSSLGSLTILNATNPGAMPDDYVTVDSAQHNYAGLMSDFAAAAGVDNPDAITKMSLNFYATGNYWSGGGIYPSGYSSGTVWFDNVSINTIPIPGAALLLCSGLFGIAAIRRRLGGGETHR